MRATLSHAAADASPPSVMQSYVVEGAEEAGADVPTYGVSSQEHQILEGDRGVEQAAKLVGGTLLPGGYFLADRIIARRMAGRLHRRLDRAFSQEKEGPTKHSTTTQGYIHSLVDRDVAALVSHDMRESLLDHALFEIGGLLVVFLSSSSETLTSGLGNAAVCYGATKIFELLQNRRRRREHNVPAQVNGIVRLRAGHALWGRMVRER